MKQALGLVEIEGMSTAVVTADAMVKAANIRIVDMENTKGLGYMTIKIAGDVGAVNAAVNAGRQVGLLHGRLISVKVIPRPSDYVEQTFCNPEPPALESPPEKKAAETAAVPEPAGLKAGPDEPEPAEAPEVKAGTDEAEPKKPQTAKSEVKGTTAPKNKK